MAMIAITTNSSIKVKPDRDMVAFGRIECVFFKTGFGLRLIDGTDVCSRSTAQIESLIALTDSDFKWAGRFTSSNTVLLLSDNLLQMRYAL